MGRPLVYLVEDTPEHARIFSRMLRESGFEVRVMDRLPDSSESFSGSTCVLIDYLLPGQRVEDFLARVRRAGKEMPCPVVLYSAIPLYLLRRAVEELRGLGFDVRMLDKLTPREEFKRVFMEACSVS